MNPTDPNAANPEQQARWLERIEALRPTLMRLALLQLRNRAWAEDAVSEALLAAIEGLPRFGGRSQLQTWVVGILKHKVLDQLRQRQRELRLDDESFNADDDEAAQMFVPDGHFVQPPQDWHAPAEALRQKQFLEVLEACMDLLPGQLGRVFLMREWLELSTEEICQELGFTSTNVWQMLSRARLRLRECLQLRWFGEQAR